MWLTWALCSWGRARWVWPRSRSSDWWTQRRCASRKLMGSRTPGDGPRQRLPHGLPPSRCPCTPLCNLHGQNDVLHCFLHLIVMARHNDQARITMLLHTAWGLKPANQVANKRIGWFLQVHASFGNHIDSNWTGNVDIIKNYNSSYFIFGCASVFSSSNERHNEQTRRIFSTLHIIWNLHEVGKKNKK